MPNCLQFGLLLALCFYCADAQNVTKTVTSFEILSFNFSEIETPFVVASWLAIASGVKILFHFIRPLSKYFPDSSLLVFVGLALGLTLHYGIESIKAEYYQLKSVYFFHFLLPPIIFDAGYFMPNRALFENFGSIMLFAMIGTVWNTLAIGGGLYLLSLYGLFSIPFNAFEVLTFTSLISAVDPVAVIAVFEEVHVNEFLFINVFGEALFNDAVSVVLYKMFKNFYDIGPERVEIADYGKGVVSFFAIAFGGTAIGIIFAFVVAIVTKFSDHIRILAPIFVFVVPYMGYLLADSMGMSAIMAISVCGMVMKQYVKGNLTPAATNSVKYFTKMLAVGAETLLFMFLGVSAIVTPHHFDWAFISITVAFCLIFRTIGVIIQCAILNKFRKKKFSVVDQFILSYGGLRGAIAFGLSVSLPDSMAAKPMFVTTTIAVIYFTVLLQGITIRPIVNWLKVERSEGRQKTMTESVFMKYIDYTMSGVEEIFGIRGEHYIRDTYERINAKILKPILMRNEEKKDFDASVIVRAYAKITLEEALDLKERLPKKKKIDKKNALQSDKRNLSTISFDSSTSTGDRSPELPYKRKDTINQLVEDPASVEMLYSLFSDLLDRKLHDIGKQKKITEPEELQDDYMAQMTVSNLRSMQAAPTNSSTNQQTNRQYSAPFSANTNQIAPEGRRMSEGSFQKKNGNYNV